MTDDPWATCKAQLTACGFTPVCPEGHCLDIQETPIYHRSCDGARMLAPVQTLGCLNSATGAWQFPSGSDGVLALCKKLAAQDPNWDSASCYCCCSCFARDTPIALPDGHKAVGDIVIGEEILVGSMSGNAVRWSPAPVTFSQGTGDGGHEPAMVYIVFGHDNRALIVSPDQPFLLHDGKLVTANKLVPGQELRGQDGEPVKLKTASIGAYTGGVHHVAAEQRWTGSIDGHLIVANGIVVGDFTLQLHLPTISFHPAVAELEELPLLGTAAYAKAYPEVSAAGDIHVYGEPVGPHPALFAPHASGDMAIPYGAVSWLTDAQAQDVQDKGNPRPLISRAGYNAALTASKLLHALYPDILFYVDWPRMEPNLWAFEQFGQKFVVMGGGLPRTPGFQYEGAVMAFASGAARFLADAPLTSGGLSCTGQADLFAFGVMSQTIWFGAPWTMEVTKAFDQISTIFELVSDKNAAGNPLDVCDSPSLACRLQTMQVGLASGTLPECAGGPKPRVLALESAVGTGTGVTLTFSQELTIDSGQTVSNYTITPQAKITSATLDPAKGFIVALDAELKPGGYEISVTGVQSVYASPLEPDPAKVSFEVAA